MIRKPHGFTLVEVMVVLVIISLSAVGIVFSLARDDVARADSEAAGLASWLQGSVQRAAVDGGAYGILIDNKGLHLEFRFRDRWLEVTDADSWSPERGVSISYADDDSLRGNAGGPQIVVLPTLNIIGGTRFELSVGEEKRVVHWDGNELRFSGIEGRGA